MASKFANNFEEYIRNNPQNKSNQRFQNKKRYNKSKDYSNKSNNTKFKRNFKNKNKQTNYQKEEIKTKTTFEKLAFDLGHYGNDLTPEIKTQNFDKNDTTNNSKVLQILNGFNSKDSNIQPDYEESFASDDTGFASVHGKKINVKGLKQDSFNIKNYQNVSPSTTSRSRNSTISIQTISTGNNIIAPQPSPLSLSIQESNFNNNDSIRKTEETNKITSFNQNDDANLLVVSPNSFHCCDNYCNDSNCMSILHKPKFQRYFSKESNFTKAKVEIFGTNREPGPIKIRNRRFNIPKQPTFDEMRQRFLFKINHNRLIDKKLNEELDNKLQDSATLSKETRRVYLTLAGGLYNEIQLFVLNRINFYNIPNLIQYLENKPKIENAIKIFATRLFLDGKNESEILSQVLNTIKICQFTEFRF